MQPAQASDLDTNISPQSIRSDYPFEFTGRTGEYFRIWIVNILLTIVTLGIYSAWAKVRNHRYFYGNTLLDGSAFEYTADPIKILRGRIIAVVVLIAYQSAGLVSTSASVIAFAILMIIMPAMIVLALRFRMRYTSWRNIPFGFVPNFKMAYLLFGLPMLLGLAMIALTASFESGLSDMGVDLETGNYEEPAEPVNESTDDASQDSNNNAETDEDSERMTPEQAAQLEEMGIQFLWVFGGLMLAFWCLFPLWLRFYYKFVADHTRYGRTHFRFLATVAEFYSIYIIAALLLVAAAVALALLLGGMSALGFSDESAVAMAGGVIGVMIFLLVQSYVQTQRANVVYSNIELEDIGFRSELKVSTMAWLYISNTVAIIVSLGLMIPWAKIRVARYRASTMTLYANNFDAFQARAAADVDAEGAEISDFMDFDLGL
ncbi:MAG: YjgN family protein [Pseudomonadales bacterium]